jgi:hypothetical protein
MMPQFLLQTALVGLGAGTCSALLLAAWLSGSAFSLVLVFLAPLPILTAAIGWSHWAGLFAAAIAALASGAVFEPSTVLDVLFGVGLPAWWLGYLTLLARPAGPTGELEWYPPGRLVLWCAAVCALVTMVDLIQLAQGEASIADALRTSFEKLLRAQMHIPADKPLSMPGIDDPNRLIDVLVVLFPVMAAALATLVELINLGLAARIASVSGRLRRPWPDLATMRLPAATPAALAAALAGSFIPGVAGTAATVTAGCLLVAYAALGFAVLHGITRHLQSRLVVLSGVYALVALLWWPLLLMTLLGLIDTAFDLRARVAAARGPPAPLA